MTGLFLLFVVLCWIAVAIVLSRWITEKVKTTWKRRSLRFLVFVLLLPLPVLDELIGGFQFRALCAANAAEFRLGVSDPQGRVTRFSSGPTSERVKWTFLPIRHSTMRYTDIETGQMVVEFDSYIVKGGIFIHTLGISEGNAPLTIGHSYCSPERKRGEVVSKTMGFKVIN